MKKGIVMEKHRHYTIIMTEEGFFYKVKPVKDAVIGTVVTSEILEAKKFYQFFYPGKKRPHLIQGAVMVCVVLLIALPIYFVTGSSKTYAYVNVDINPSVEIKIDNHLHVQSIKPLNGDATIIINQLTGYENKPLPEVVSMIMDESERTGLIKNGKNVLVGVSYADSKALPVLDTLDNYFVEHNEDWQVATFLVPKEIRKVAVEHKKSMNQQMAINLESEADENSFKRINNEKKTMNKEEEAIINSFYNNTEKNTEKSQMKEDTKDTSAQDQLSSEQKQKIGAIHSNKHKNKDAHTSNGKNNQAHEHDHDHNGKLKHDHKEKEWHKAQKSPKRHEKEIQRKENNAKQKHHYKTKRHHKDNHNNGYDKHHEHHHNGNNGKRHNK